MRLFLWLINFFLLITTVRTSCRIEEDPVNLSTCISIDLTAIAFVVRGKDDIPTVCEIANRWMECVKTYSRGCVGHFVYFRFINLF